MTQPADPPIIAHARSELTRLGESDDTIDLYLAAMRAFAVLNKTEGEGANEVLLNLMNWRNLSELTTDPAEWKLIAPKIWQSTRNPEAFSDDGGNTYKLLSEGYTIHNSEVPPAP